eukprot:GEMP01020460.1.p1 GENE.GEMP01020460.1~~GEMP01020460.1.p1  ORF type:complete len:640 (+),score=128.32 GEMP01020460.1:84-2003(+)
MSPRDIKQIEATLREIFDYYGSTVSGTALKSAKFQKLALDADLVDDQLTSAKIDLIFKKVCGQVNPMHFPSFMDAVVLLATEKFPDLLPQQATLRLYDDHFSTFANPSLSVFDQLEDDFFLSFEPFRSQLHSLYIHYFQAECNPHFKQGKISLSQQSLKAFGSLLEEFEITPYLVSKATAFATFREVAKAEAVPDRVLKYLTSSGSDSSNFTFAHFVCAMLRVARKLFPHLEDPAAFLQLLERMDAVNPGKAIFFVDLGQSKMSKRRSVRRSESTAESTSRPDSALKKRFPSGRSRLSIKEDIEQRLAQRRQSSEMSSSSHTGDGQMIGAAPTYQERLVNQLFGYYAALGNPLNRTYLSTLKWNRFLRDAKLIPAETATTQEGPPKRLSMSPSCVFESPVSPPLSQVDVDLIFLQAQGQSARHHMSARTFEIALHMIAEKVYGGRIDAFQKLCDDVLASLSERLLELHGHDVAQCAIAMAEPDMVALFAQALDGLARLFGVYARNGIWTAECFAKFCNDFDITQELSHMPLQRIFSDCVHVEYSAGQGNLRELSLLSFQLALVLIATKVQKEDVPTASKVSLLFQRLNAAALSNGIPPHAKGTFLPVEKRGLRASLSKRQIGSSRSSLTWTNLMEQAAS